MYNGNELVPAAPPGLATYAASMVAGARAHNAPPASSHAMCADLGAIWQLAQLAQAGHAQPGYTHHAFSHAGVPAAAPVPAPAYHGQQHPAAGTFFAASSSCAHLPLHHLPLHSVPEQKEVLGGTVSAHRKKELDLLCAALQPRDHTHELLHKAVSGLGIKDSQHDKHSLQLNEVGTHSRRLRSDSSVSSSASYCSNFSSVSAEASMSTCAGTSTEAEVGLEAGGRHRIASTGSMQRASRAPKHAKDRRDAPNVIYPRRKVGQDMRNSNQVVVTAEILEQVKFSKSHLPILYSMAGALTFSAFLQHFHMPLHDAATKLGLCATAIKKACRRFGILRWPFRDRHRILSSCGSGASVTLPTTKRRESQRESERASARARARERIPKSHCPGIFTT